MRARAVANVREEPTSSPRRASRSARRRTPARRRRRPRGLPARRPRPRGTPRSPRRPRCPTRPRQRSECCARRATRRLSSSSPPRPSPPPRRASGADRRRESCRCHCCQTHPSHACPWCAALRAHRNNGRCAAAVPVKMRLPVYRCSALPKLERYMVPEHALSGSPSINAPFSPALWACFKSDRMPL